MPDIGLTKEILPVRIFCQSAYYFFIDEFECRLQIQKACINHIWIPGRPFRSTDRSPNSPAIASHSKNVVLRASDWLIWLHQRIGNCKVSDEERRFPVILTGPNHRTIKKIQSLATFSGSTSQPTPCRNSSWWPSSSVRDRPYIDGKRQESRPSKRLYSCCAATVGCEHEKAESQSLQMRPLFRPNHTNSNMRTLDLVGYRPDMRFDQCYSRCVLSDPF